MSLPESYLRNILPRKSTCFGLLLVSILMAFGSIGIHRWWKNERLKTCMQEATTARENQDRRLEYEALSKAIQINPIHLPALVEMAQLAELFRAPEQVDFWARAQNLEPNNPEFLNKVFLSGLKWKRIPLTVRLFKAAKLHHQDDPFYFSRLGVLYMSSGKIKEAKSAFAEAIELDPNNLSFRLNQIELGLLSPLAKNREMALVEIDQLNAPTEVAVQLLKLKAALIRSDSDQVREEAKRILGLAGVSLQDRIRAVSALHEVGDESAGAQFAKLAQEANGLNEQYMLAKALNRIGETEFVLRWAEEWSENSAQRPPLCIAIADAHIKERNLEALQALMETADWTGIQSIALLIRSGMQLTNDGTDDPLKRNFAEKRYRLEQMYYLAELAQLWGFDDQYTWILEEVISEGIFELGALKLLYRYHQENKDARDMLLTMLRAEREDPDDRVIKNNIAYLGLLLNKNTSTAKRYALKNYETDPENPAHISTLSLVHFRNKKYSEALEQLEALPKRLQGKPQVQLLRNVYQNHLEGSEEPNFLCVSERDVLDAEWEFLQQNS